MVGMGGTIGINLVGKTDSVDVVSGAAIGLGACKHSREGGNGVDEVASCAACIGLADTVALGIVSIADSIDAGEAVAGIEIITHKVSDTWQWA